MARIPGASAAKVISFETLLFIRSTKAIEGPISFLLISLALSMLAAAIVILIGFYTHMKQAKTDQ